MNYIYFNSVKYPEFQSKGFSSQFTFPFALQYCTGYGYDIGCGSIDWGLPGACLIDKAITNNEYDAYNLPDELVDYIFSSHCLEHLENWVKAIQYWTTKIKLGGILYLYLPDYSQEYWRPWNNPKHIHCLDAKHIVGLLSSLNYCNIQVSGVDLNNSFTIVAERSFVGH